jgi:uncharacterized protein
MVRPGEKVPPTSPPSLPKPILLQQSWRDVVFVHWPVKPASVIKLFPRGTQPDTFNGQTYVGVVGFTIPATRLGGLLNIGATYELNVRLYSVDAQGHQGVVFLSMDVNHPAMVLGARLLPQLPYMWSHLEPIRPAPAIAGLRVQRRLPSPLEARVELEVGTALRQPTDLDVFLTGRWGLHTTTILGTTWVPVTHRLWPLHRARLRHIDESLLVSTGVPAPDGDPVGTLWSPGLDAEVGWPRRANST